jgi:ferrous iron transport protein A
LFGVPFNNSGLSSLVQIWPVFLRFFELVVILMNTLRLADLTPGASGIVTAISGASRIASRLMEMGFVPGVAVKVLRRAPFGGPIQYRIHNVSVSMRIAEAACISVTNDSGWSEPVAAVPVSELHVAAT